MFTRFVGLIHLSVIMPPFYSAVSFDSVSFDSVSFDSVSFDSDSIDSDSIDSDSIDSDSIDSMVGWLSAACAVCVTSTAADSAVTWGNSRVSSGSSDASA